MGRPWANCATLLLPSTACAKKVLSGFQVVADCRGGGDQARGRVEQVFFFFAYISWTTRQRSAASFCWRHWSTHSARKRQPCSQGLEDCCLEFSKCLPKKFVAPWSTLRSGSGASRHRSSQEGLPCRLSSKRGGGERSGAVLARQSMEKHEMCES